MKTCNHCGKHYKIKPSWYEESKYCSRKCQLDFYNSHRKILDLTGEKFNKLTVISLEGRDKRKNALWKCLCDCGNFKLVNSANLKSGIIKCCGCVGRPSIEEVLKQRRNEFYTKIKIDEKGCHNWIGQLDASGYGEIRIKSKGVRAHRFSWEMHRGEIPNGLWVLHHCDNRRCVNCDHLYLGTPKDNVRDMVERRRMNHSSVKKGSKSNLSKLTEEKVTEIRKMRSEGHKYQTIADKFNVGIGCISHIITGRNWK